MFVEERKRMFVKERKRICLWKKEKELCDFNILIIKCNEKFPA